MNSRQLRIVLVNMPRLVRDMVERALRAQPDFTVVGVISTPAELEAMSRKTRPQFVIVGLQQGRLPRECESALTERPEMKLLGIEERAGRAVLYELRPKRTPIGEISPTTLADTIRAAAAQPLFSGASDGWA